MEDDHSKIDYSPALSSVVKSGWGAELAYMAAPPTIYTC